MNKTSLIEIKLADGKNLGGAMMKSPQGMSIREIEEKCTPANSAKLARPEAANLEMNTKQGPEYQKVIEQGGSESTIDRTSEIANMAKALAEDDSLVNLGKVSGAAPTSENTEAKKATEQTTAAKGIHTWASVVAGNKFASKGMNLNYVAPTIKDGQKVIQLELEDIEERNIKWGLAIILYVIEYSPLIGAVERFLTSQWKLSTKPEIYYHNEDYFVIRFSTMEEKNEVSFSGPHTINSRPVIMKAWTANFSLQKLGVQQR